MVPNCDCCCEEMSFPGYACESPYCRFYLHKSCAELAEKISHPLHPHPLILLSVIPRSFPFIICDGCRNLYKKGFTYYCTWSCGFNLHPKCASKQQTFNKELTLYHFCHKHALNFCNLSRVSYYKPCCCCKQSISGSAYCCLECEFFIHESCKEIPKQVQHPFHPQHLLLAQAVEVKIRRWAYGASDWYCNACKSSINGVRISCNMCKFHLHVSCANQNRWASPLKHKCHEHNMYYFIVKVKRWRWIPFFKCNKCHEECLDDEPFYRCVECDFNLHLKCIPIPSVVLVTWKHHHPLTLIDSIKEDNPLIQYLMDSNDKVDYSMDYYCDVCETPGNPKHHTYYCKECIYIAHVECIISKDNTPLENPSNLNLKHGTEQKMSDEADFHPAESDHSTEQAAQSMSKKNGATSDEESHEELFSHPSHHHKLTLLQLEPTNGGSSEEKIKDCYGCNEVMCFPGYACHECEFYLHKSCAELPPKILHPLHPHPLTCSLKDDNEVLICDGCRDLYGSGFKFRCSWSCGFNLDAKCASKQDLEYHQTFKELTLYRFYHKHALKLFNAPKRPIRCCCCRQMISTGSSAYCCIECRIFIHESCTEIPMEVHHPFHPQHILFTQPIDKYDSTGCDACMSSIEGIKISCNECHFDLHVSCANPNRWARALKNVCHEHNMYYFFGDDTTRSFECNKCDEEFLDDEADEECLDDEAFYRCVECDFNLHLECIPIPSVVMITQKHHHSLTLIDSVKDDNPLIQYLMDSNDKIDYSMDYYCDDCETPGNPKHHAYCCKECIYIAHVECIISKVIRSSSTARSTSSPLSQTIDPPAPSPTISRPGTPSSSKSIRIPSSILSSVVATVSIKRDVGVVPAVRDGGDHWADARPAGTETAEGRVEGEAPGGVCSGDSHWRVVSCTKGLSCQVFWITTCLVFKLYNI
ncbi:hypothetical protein LWI29_015463 [Acer saccharum]|uniref:Phorbol-ester/DAG-type domain-containing protein n=1 Tax=Acer saccharum TaxID=4024 RepID=A0AA39W1R0_ACESA|nr:hypothetical protein LWI29_015463 [Acer saccharum]